MEMVLVLLIMAVLFAMVIPSMGSIGQDPEEGQPWKEIADLLRSSRNLALEKAVTVRMVIDPETGLYRIDSVGARGSGMVDRGELSLGINMTVSSDSTRVKFAFRPDGSAFADSLIIRSSGYATKIWVETFTGEVRIEER